MWAQGRRWVALVFVALSAMPAAATESDSQRIERLQQQVDELQREINEMKAKQQAEVPSATAAAAPFAPLTAEGRSPMPKLIDRVQIGGYGSVRFEANSARDEHTTFTLRRLVLTADAAIAPRLRSYFELEFERFRKLGLERTAVASDGGLKVKQAIEGTNNSEISLEQAWLQYDLFGDPLAIRIGAVLVPLGRFNLNHDDNRSDLPRRSLVDRGAPVLPATAAWDELGAGVNGKVSVGAGSLVDYQIYVVNGAVISPEAESVVQTGGGEGRKQEVASNFSVTTGTFSKDLKSAKAVTGRLAFSPVLGHEIAGSLYRGRYTPDFLPSESITAFSADGLSIWGPLELEGEFVQSDFGDVANVARAFARRAAPPAAAETDLSFALEKLAETRRGYWFEGRYRFRPSWLKGSIFGYDVDDPVLTAVIRGEQVWLDGLLTHIDFSSGGAAALTRIDRRIDRITIGGSYRPIPLVAFQLAYEYTHVDQGALSEVTNFLATGDSRAHALILGAAFGF